MFRVPVLELQSYRHRSGLSAVVVLSEQGLLDQSELHSDAV